MARRDIAGWGREPDREGVNAWVDDLELGETYVCLDGVFVPTNATGIEYSGWHSRHRLDQVPQLAALADPSIIEKILANRSYWVENALPED